MQNLSKTFACLGLNNFSKLDPYLIEAAVLRFKEKEKFFG